MDEVSLDEGIRDDRVDFVSLPMLQIRGVPVVEGVQLLTLIETDSSGVSAMGSKLPELDDLMLACWIRLRVISFRRRDLTPRSRPEVSVRVDIVVRMEAFLAALAGALIGGAASTLGALIVSRRGQVREHRVRIYDELMPQLMEYVPQKSWPGTTKAQLPPHKYRDLFDPIRRAAHVIGSEDAEKVDGIYDVLVRWAELVDNATRAFDEKEGKTYLVLKGASQEDYDAVNNDFLEAVDTYRLWLRNKLDNKI